MHINRVQPLLSGASDKRPMSVANLMGQLSAQKAIDGNQGMQASARYVAVPACRGPPRPGPSSVQRSINL